MNNNLDKQYNNLVSRILETGEWKGNRTGVDCLTIAGAMIEHDMQEGFPLLTSRKLPFKSTKVELEFFIKGLSSKHWLKERGCNYWNGWANPQKVKYGNDDASKAAMAAEDDLGSIYGVQWRNFNGVDQLKNIVNKLKTDPSDRRMICSAWAPHELNKMALPPCHYAFQVTVINGKLNLAWNQRSVDVACGLPANISSYGLLLHLLAKEANLKEGKLIGFLMDTHIYSNHVDGLKLQLTQNTHILPTIQTNNFTSIFDWVYSETELLNYQASHQIKYDVAI